MPDSQLAQVITGACILLAIAFIPVRQPSSNKFAFAGFMAGIAVIIACTSALFHFADFVVDGDDEQILKAQIDHVAAAEANGHIPRNLLIIDGSSQTALGLDIAAVEADLGSRGYDTTIVDLSLVGGNLLERYTLDERFKDEMQRHRLSYGSNTRLLLELHPKYDADPLRFFDVNVKAARTYYYANLGNLYFTVNYYLESNRRFDAKTINILGDMLSHCFVWSFKIGFMPEMKYFDALSDLPPYTPETGQYETFVFNRYDAHMYTRLDPRIAVQPSFLGLEVHTNRLKDLFSNSIGEVGYFLVPSLDRIKMQYGHTYCVTHKNSACIDSSNPTLLNQLDNAQYWLNRDHLNSEGSPVFSAYFADELVAQAVVKQ